MLLNSLPSSDLTINSFLLMFLSKASSTFIPSIAFWKSNVSPLYKYKMSSKPSISGAALYIICRPSCSILNLEFSIWSTSLNPFNNSFGLDGVSSKSFEPSDISLDFVCSLFDSFDVSSDLADISIPFA